MLKTPVTALVSNPSQKFVYIYDPARQWTFLVELIGINKERDIKKTYPCVVRKEGPAPAQHAPSHILRDKLMEAEEGYDLGAEEMAEGFGSEGETDSSSAADEFGGSSGSDEEAY